MRCRTLLPVLFGLLSMALMAWDAYNRRVVDSWRIADVEGPTWPYRTPRLLLPAINAPAFAITLPLWAIAPDDPDLRYAVFLPPILLWWWWFGSRIDCGILGRRYFRWPRPTGFILIVVAAALFFIAVQDVVNGIRWWANVGRELPRTELLQLVQPLGPALWWAGLGLGCSLAAVRLFRRRLPEFAQRSLKRSVASLGLSTVALLAITLHLLGAAPERPWVPRSPDTYAHIRGTVIDEAGNPLKSVEVELFPSEKTSEARWYARQFEFTDALGGYSFRQLEPGTYIVAVHYYDAPNVRRPYARGLYPGVETEGDAARIAVVPNSPVTLTPLRVRHLPLATIKVEVRWPDGSRPKWSNLLFHNPSYPSQAVVGDEAPGIANGTGEFTLPEGFAYDASASVMCDAGSIESRESRPVQRVTAGAGVTPNKMTFIIPGPPCKLWTTK